MIRYIIAALLALAPLPAFATTCSQANSECESKGLLNPIFGPPIDAESNAKTLLNVITNPAVVSNAKLLLNVILIPGNASPSVIPAMPLTIFR